MLIRGTDAQSSCARPVTCHLQLSFIERYICRYGRNYSAPSSEPPAIADGNE